jgi:hypothetical protein
LSGFLLDLRQSLVHKGFAKILDISTGMPAIFANPYASRSQHISSQKIAQLRLNEEVISSSSHSKNSTDNSSALEFLSYINISARAIENNVLSRSNVADLSGGSAKFQYLPYEPLTDLKNSSQDTVQQSHPF